jgi:hypothetical protein
MWNGCAADRLHAAGCEDLVSQQAETSNGSGSSSNGGGCQRCRRKSLSCGLVAAVFFGNRCVTVLRVQMPALRAQMAVLLDSTRQRAACAAGTM